MHMFVHSVTCYITYLRMKTKSINKGIGYYTIILNYTSWESLGSLNNICCLIIMEIRIAWCCNGWTISCTF